jgi:hypothetical protein
MLCNYTVTNEENKTRYFIVSKIILHKVNRYKFQPITRPSSDETNTKYAKYDHIKMKEVSLTLLIKGVFYSITSIRRTVNKF